ncbi:anthranilate synthase component I family protein [Marinicellulosiphila megalodicopiae]|uniref:anthranilate synthase component I family protein n=1 Tax=Marinicellulosiphila megalodicopiae TaxID=2724896 RepID=UPI003BB1AA26
MSLIELPYQADISERFSHFNQFAWSMLFDSCQQERFDWFSGLPTKTITLNSDTPLLEQIYNDEQTLIQSNEIQQDIFDYLNGFEYQDTHPNTIPFTGGWLGYLSYDLGQQRILNKTSNKTRAFNTPLAQLGFYDWACINDHQLKKSYLWFNCSEYKQFKIESIFNTVKANNKKQLPEFHWQALTEKTDYISNIQRILDYIINGDCYQTNYTQCWETNTDNLDTLALYQSRKRKCPTPFSGFITTPELTLSCHSPEAFIQIKDSQVNTFPIKGTIKRSTDPIEDALLKSQLASSEKDRAENIMITDLLRNDLSITAKTGSVKCPEICKVHSYSNVHHLVSQVSSVLDEKKFTLMDVVKHSFPGGSITGAPKKRAMQIIDELEDQSRSLYCGSMIALSQNKQLHSNILIRSFIYHNNQLRCYAGGGIVMESIAENEYQESLSKVSILKF